MDETPVWLAMVSDATVDSSGTNTVTVKSTGYKKSCVSVCLAAKADGTKISPMIVLKNAKREVNAMDKEFKNFIIFSKCLHEYRVDFSLG